MCTNLIYSKSESLLGHHTLQMNKLLHKILGCLQAIFRPSEPFLHTTFPVTPDLCARQGPHPTRLEEKTGSN